MISNDETIVSIVGGLVLILIVVLSYSIGYKSGKVDGRWEGFEEQRELTKKFECEYDYSNVAQKDISGECLKYFIEN